MGAAGRVNAGRVNAGRVNPGTVNAGRVKPGRAKQVHSVGELQAELFGPGTIVHFQEVGDRYADQSDRSNRRLGGVLKQKVGNLEQLGLVRNDLFRRRLTCGYFKIMIFYFQRNRMGQ